MPKEDPVYMTDDMDLLAETIKTRENLFPADLKEQWATTVPEIRTIGREECLYVLGHEVMAAYERPYMEELAEIVTRPGGDILEVGYGLGMLAEEIEKRRAERQLGKHVIIELNHYLAEKARKDWPHATVVEGDYEGELPEIEGRQFDGIVYDGYPMQKELVHRDAIAFIERIVREQLLKNTGVLTFYTDAVEKLGTKFRSYLTRLGLGQIDVTKVPVRVPKRLRQTWRADHFLAPKVQYGEP